MVLSQTTPNANLDYAIVMVSSTIETDILFVCIGVRIKKIW
jgi:hypothetical protein